MDPTVQVALIGIFTTVVTTAGVVTVAIINNRRERDGAAENAMELTLRERIVLRDERIAVLEQKLHRALAQNEELREELAALKKEKGSRNEH